MILKDLCIKLNNKAPKEKYAMSHDKVGLFVGDVNRDIKKIVTVTDASLDVINYSIENNIDMILCHHPFMFDPVDRVTTEDLFQKKLYKLIENNIAVYSMHTNLDSVAGGLNDIMIDLLGLKNSKPIETKLVDNIEYPSIGRVGELEREMSCEEFKEHCLKSFKLPYAKFNFNFNRNEKKIKKVGLCSGSGMSIFDKACDMGIDAYVCGDIKHDQYLYATERNVFVLDLGHYETECTGSIVLGNYIKEIDSSIELINFEVLRNNKLVKSMLGM